VCSLHQRQKVSLTTCDVFGRMTRYPNADATVSIDTFIAFACVCDEQVCWGQV